MPPLQKFDTTSSQYERPNLNWVCGRVEDGEACRVGPDSKGKCCGVAECQPRRDGDRWNCTRPISAGGACDMGPMSDGTCCHPIPPCVPVRTLRAKRGLMVRWAVVLTIGFLAVVLGSNGRNWLMPGPLISAHASLGDCQSCHATVAEGAFGWIHSAFMPASPEKDSDKCIGCHVAGKTPLRAHGAAPTVLAASTERIFARSGAGQPVASHSADQVLPCATCHIEHRGAKATLTQLPETACQSCHVAKFAAFSSGHPEFDRYPYERRTRIIFDHGSHFGTHFPKALKEGTAKKNKPAACVNCHLPAENGRLMVSRPFEETCSGCHLDQIVGKGRATGPRGVSFLTVPGIDVIALGKSIGTWPSDAEDILTPIMKMLLSGDSKVKAAIEASNSIDLAALDKASPAHLAAAHSLAWAVKGLFKDLSDGGSAKLRERLVSSTGKAVDEQLLARLIALIPRDVLSGAQRDWLPDLARELNDHAAGKTAAIPSKSAGPSTSVGSAIAGGVKDTGDILSSAKDTGDILSGTKDTGDILSGTKDTGDILSGGKDTGDILSGAKDTGDILSGAKDTGDILSGAKDTGDILSGGKDTGDILSGGKDTGDILSGAKDTADILSGTKDTGDILSGGKDTGDILSGTKDTGDILSGAPAPVITKEIAATTPAPRPKAIDPEEFARLGGWYRQEFSVLYHPTGHADPFLKAWLDYTASTFGTPGQAAAESVFRQLVDKDAQGQCVKCHSIEKGPDNRLSIMWNPKKSGGAGGGFTRFVHEPHLSMATEKSCQTCHQLDSKAKYQKAFGVNRDPHRFASNFKSISQDVCGTCHKKAEAGESCVQCHNYHAEPIMPAGMMQNDVAGAANSKTK